MGTSLNKLDNKRQQARPPPPANSMKFSKIDLFPYHRPLAIHKSFIGGLLSAGVLLALFCTFVLECVRWTDTKYATKDSTMELDTAASIAVTDDLSLEVKLDGQPFYDETYFTVEFSMNKMWRDNSTQQMMRETQLLESMPCKNGRHRCPVVPESGSDHHIQGLYGSPVFRFFAVSLQPCYQQHIGKECHWASYLNRYPELKERFGNDFEKAKRHWRTHGQAMGLECRRERAAINATNGTNATARVAQFVSDHNDSCVSKDHLDAWLSSQYLTTSLSFRNNVNYKYNKTDTIYTNVEPTLWQGVETEFTLTKYKIADNIMADETRPCSQGYNQSNSSTGHVFTPECGMYLTFKSKDVRRSGNTRGVKYYLKLDQSQREEVYLPNSLASIAMAVSLLYLMACQMVGPIASELAKRWPDDVTTFKAGRSGGVDESDSDIEAQRQRSKRPPSHQCPSGYPWVREKHGWRCEGGSHFEPDCHGPHVQQVI